MTTCLRCGESFYSQSGELICLDCREREQTGPSLLVEDQQAIRSEKALNSWPGWMPGGNLTLYPGVLTWKRSPWAYVLVGLGNRGPQRLEVNLACASVTPAGRMVPWPLLLLAGLILLGSAVLVLTLGGWFRKCLTIQIEGIDGQWQDYSFAVRDVDGWLSDIEEARRLGSSSRL